MDTFGNTFVIHATGSNGRWYLVKVTARSGNQAAIAAKQIVDNELARCRGYADGTVVLVRR